jgi:hypothetical protein
MLPRSLTAIYPRLSFIELEGSICSARIDPDEEITSEGGKSMNEPLTIYLQDHLAGATAAIELLQVMGERTDPLGGFAKHLLTEIELDRETLQILADKVGSGENVIKEVASWLSEKVTRLKFGHGMANPFGTFQAIEFLSLGILGKLALWRALETLSLSDTRLSGVPFNELALRAKTQFSQVEERRLEIAGTAFRLPN